MIDSITPIIPAAGYGQIPAESGKPKLLAELIEGSTMIEILMNSLGLAGLNSPVIILNPLFENRIRPYISENATIVIQPERLGAAPAVMQALEYVQTEHVMVLFADMALWRPETLREFAEHHLNCGKKMSLMSISAADWDEHSARKYGRIAKDANGRVLGIFEPEDQLPETASICDINPSVYCIEKQGLPEAIESITHITKKGEKTINSVIYHYQETSEVAEYMLRDPNEALGVNDFEQLNAARDVYRNRVLAGLV